MSIVQCGFPLKYGFIIVQVMLTNLDFEHFQFFIGTVTISANYHNNLNATSNALSLYITHAYVF